MRNETTEAKHTPTPWAVLDGHPSDVLDIVRPWEHGVVQAGSHPTFGSGHGAHVASLVYHSSGGVATREQAKANAEFIVKAVNCHEELVAACKLALTAFMPWGTDHPAQDALKAILAKVEA